MRLEQKRATLAYGHVTNLPFGNDEKQKKQYGVMALKLTALIRSAGLCQALHFIASRGKDPYNQLLEHLALQLKRVNDKITDKKTLLDKTRAATVQEYLLLTGEALAVANWYARLAQSELNVTLTDETEDGRGD